MFSQRWVGGLVASAALLSCTTFAHAHFKLLKPASWLNEDDLGGPQKGSPCGPGNSRPFIGDAVNPNPLSGAVTTFHTGETVSVQLDETVYHPGYFRISLAKKSAADATMQDFPDPALTDPVECFYDKAAVKTSPHDNVLGDGLFTADAKAAAEGRQLMQEIKLPDEPCDECTLQIVQVMYGHGASSCFYYHCANIEIVAANGGSAGAGAAGQPASPTAGGGASVPEAVDDGGCTVTRAGTRGAATAAWCLLGVVAVLSRRRRSRRALHR